jgi:hypothetical protein
MNVKSTEMKDLTAIIATLLISVLIVTALEIGSAIYVLHQ